jgi:hypothetical protein
MAKQILKYKLNPSTSLVSLHRSAKIISAGVVEGNFVVWAEVLLGDKEFKDCNVVGIPTNAIRPFKESTELEIVRYKFINTVILSNGLEFHMYEKIILKVRKSKNIASLNHPEIPLI